MSNPLVSVVLPCFDAEPFLPAALDSLLAQTHRRLEIVALDDGSTDSTLNTLERYATRDSRVRILRNERNLGLIETLNRGVAEARGEFIARMDADDVAAPARVGLQLGALSRRLDVDVVGAGIELLNENGRSLGARPVRCFEPGGARFMALFATPLAHTTLLARAAVMRAHPYGGSPHSLHTEDYELFTRMLRAGVGFMNLGAPLVSVRVRREGMSLRHEELQVSNFVASAGRHLETTLGLRPGPGVLSVLVNRIDRTVKARDLAAGLRCLGRIEAEFLERETEAAQEISRIADQQYVDILIQAGLKGRPSVRLAAAALALSHAPRLVSPTARRYLAGKLRR